MIIICLFLCCKYYLLPINSYPNVCRSCCFQAWISSFIEELQMELNNHQKTFPLQHDDGRKVIDEVNEKWMNLGHSREKTRYEYIMGLWKAIINNYILCVRYDFNHGYVCPWTSILLGLLDGHAVKHYFYTKGSISHPFSRIQLLNRLLKSKQKYFCRKEESFARFSLKSVRVFDN